MLLAQGHETNKVCLESQVASLLLSCACCILLTVLKDRSDSSSVGCRKVVLVAMLKVQVWRCPLLAVV